MSRKIYFKGYYGFKNIGDDIFCVTADWICNNIWLNNKPYFIGEHLPKVSKNAHKKNIKNYRLRKLYEILLLLRSDYIIYFGGSLFSKVNGMKDVKYLLRKFPFLNSKLGTVGTSVGPFKTDKDYQSIQSFLSKFKFISVRDYSSLDILSKMELGALSHFSFDTAILIDEVFPSLKFKDITNSSGKIKIAVSLCHYEKYVNEDVKSESKREKSVMNFIDNIICEYHNIEEIVFFEFNGHQDKGDIEITKDFYNGISNRIKSRIVYYTTETESFIKELNQCDFLIGMRLHSAILAYALNIPFILVEYHKKCTEFLNTIEHNYRFKIEDNDHNIEMFQNIIEAGFVPKIKDPQFFKQTLMDEIKRINEML